MIYLCCIVFHTNSHDPLLIVLKDYDDQHLLLEIIHLMTETQLSKKMTKHARKERDRIRNINIESQSYSKSTFT